MAIEKIRLDDGSVYEGEVSYSGKPHGDGKMTCANGDIYEGYFYDAKLYGEGQCTYADGKTENGYWFEGKFLGEGSIGKSKYDKKCDNEARALQDRICP